MLGRGLNPADARGAKSLSTSADIFISIVLFYFFFLSFQSWIFLEDNRLVCVCAAPVPLVGPVPVSGRGLSQLLWMKNRCAVKCDRNSESQMKLLLSTCLCLFIGCFSFVTSLFLVHTHTLFPKSLPIDPYTVACIMNTLFYRRVRMYRACNVSHNAS